MESGKGDSDLKIPAVVSIVPCLLWCLPNPDLSSFIYFEHPDKVTPGATRVSKHFVKVCGGYGSKLNHQGTAGVGPCFHLLGFHLGYLFPQPGDLSGSGPRSAMLAKASSVRFGGRGPLVPGARSGNPLGAALQSRRRSRKSAQRARARRKPETWVLFACIFCL